MALRSRVPESLGGTCLAIRNLRGFDVPDVKIDHVSLTVSDLDKAIAFYASLTGLNATFREFGMTREIVEMTGVEGMRCNLGILEGGDGKVALELIEFIHDDTRALPDAPVNPRQGHVGFNVADFRAARARAEELGARMLGEVTDFPECTSAYFIEPAGSVFELTEMKDI